MNSGAPRLLTTVALRPATVTTIHPSGLLLGLLVGDVGSVVGTVVGATALTVGVSVNSLVGSVLLSVADSAWVIDAVSEEEDEALHETVGTGDRVYVGDSVSEEEKVGVGSGVCVAVADLVRDCVSVSVSGWELVALDVRLSVSLGEAVALGVRVRGIEEEEVGRVSVLDGWRVHDEVAVRVSSDTVHSDVAEREGRLRVMVSVRTLV
eukprot:Hpha_TRINITY_DN15834_c0_g2::TRINITY_DN15834_c0_g2_i1::g.190360::m.190360